MMNMFHLVDIKKFTFEFQVGPLLDWVASLRACTGYPDPALVAQASYLNENKVSTILHTEGEIKVCMWLREISSCTCLTVLPGPDWVLLSKTNKPLFPPLYNDASLRSIFGQVTHNGQIVVERQHEVMTTLAEKVSSSLPTSNHRRSTPRRPAPVP